MSIDYSLWSKSLSEKAIKSLYCFYGDETFLIQKALNDLQSLCLGGGPADFNFDIFYHGDANFSQIIDACETLPMFSPKRLIVVKNINELKQKDIDLLTPYLEKNIDTSCLVLVLKKVDLRKKFYKILASHKSLVEFKSPNIKNMPQWVRVICSDLQKTINSDAMELLIEMVGSSLTDMHLELQKLSAFVGAKSEIHLEDIKAVVSKHRLESIFDLTNAIGENDRAKSLYYLAYLLDQGENELGIMALISRHIRILNLVKEGLNEGLNSSQLASRAGVPPYYLNQYLKQAQQWESSRLEHIHGALLLTDKALKSSPISTPIWLENFILKSCQP